MHARQIKLKAINYAYLMRLDKPIGSLLLLYPTLWALWLSSLGKPPISLVVIFSIGVILMRSAGCVINDLADRDIDGHVNRTQNRPLVTKVVSVNEAIALFVSLMSLSALLLVFLNALSFFLAFLGGLIATIYPFCKRFFKVPQLVLGFAFSWGCPMAFAASLDALPIECWILMGLSFCWIVAYDTMYAMADKDDDLKIGIYSSAIYFQRADRLVIKCLHLLMAALWLLLAYRMAFTVGFYLAYAGGLVNCLYQHHLIKDREPDLCFKAFLNNQWYGLLMSLAVLLGLN